MHSGTRCAIKIELEGAMDASALSIASRSGDSSIRLNTAEIESRGIFYMQLLEAEFRSILGMNMSYMAPW